MPQRQTLLVLVVLPLVLVSLALGIYSSSLSVVCRAVLPSLHLRP